ncbi:MAG: transposase [Candidatus Niyogibacteria bacterium]|nr:transposase [Candidatus Niyogibacteria bacterium]
MERKFEFSIGEFYHVFNRGNDKRSIFENPNDYSRFLALLYLCNGSKPVNIRDQFPKGLPFGKFDELEKVDKGEELVAVGAYCLMPNHFHLLLKETAENSITKFMGKVSTAYSMYYNKRYGRTGGLFEGTFQARHTESDEYLKYLFSYIHLNPLKFLYPEWRERGVEDTERARDFLNRYGYSSYADYAGKKRPERIVLTQNAFPEYFNESGEFEDFITEWIQFSSVPEENLLGREQYA